MQPEQQNKVETIRKQIILKRIIPRSFNRQLHHVQYTIAIAQSKNASAIIKLIKQIENQVEVYPAKKQDIGVDYFQLDHLIIKEDVNKGKDKSFLKRVKRDGNRIEVLLCRNNCQLKNKIVQVLTEAKLIQSTIVKELPDEGPVTKQQFEQWAKFWPINFIQPQFSKQIIHSKSSIQFLQQLISSELAQKPRIILLDPSCNSVLLTENQQQCKQNTIDHPVMRLLKNWSNSQQFKSKPEKYYYLTGLKMLMMSQGICGMCAMALVHSRLQTIYLTFQPNSIMDQVMGCRKLNHQIKMISVK